MKVDRCLFCGKSDLALVTRRVDDTRILRCANCGLLMVGELPKDQAKLYGRDYFEKETDSRTGYVNYLSSPVATIMGKYAFARLFAGPGSHLDLGSADGSLMEIFAANGFETRGLEISKEAVTVAHEKGLHVELSNLENFGQGQPQFALITGFDILEHVYDLHKVLGQVKSHLSKGGYFVFSTLSVKKAGDPTEYWYNNSLEHTLYFTPETLRSILAGVFGAGSVALVELEINGSSELWGVVKQGRLSEEQALLDWIAAGKYKQSEPEVAYFLSLFYNQISKFPLSRDINRHFATTWTTLTALEAWFYHDFLQGHFETAVNLVTRADSAPPANDGPFWQAVSHAREQAYSAKKEAMVQESNEEIISLREQVFHLKGELHTIKGYRIIGRLLRLRARLKHYYHRLIDIRIHYAHEIRWRLSHIVPRPARRMIKRALRLDFRPTQFVAVKAKAWGKAGPLFSVVIPFYNRADTIDETLDSLREQTFQAFEVIVVDDGSTDADSIRLLKSLDLEDLRGQIIRQPNQGPAAARNTGIAKSRGKYVICLDSDDAIEPTYIEKVIAVFETSPDIALVTTDRQDFGVSDKVWKYIPYDALELFNNNMVASASAFTKRAWEESGGYKAGIGYEDWEFWLNLSEHGYWGRLIPEPLFRYRTSMQSRFVEDKDAHWSSVKTIQELHSKYKKNVGRLLAQTRHIKHVTIPDGAFVNLSHPTAYAPQNADRPNVLIIIPWMTFGGAETLIYNFCQEIKDQFNLSFITGLKSEHEWEYKFREITPRIYHLTNLFEDPALHLEFIANFIETRGIEAIHVIHTSFLFPVLPELKRRFPNLKVGVTLFNDRAEHFAESIKVQQYIDAFSSDNQATAHHFEQELGADRDIRVIPNGIDCFNVYSPALFDRTKEREAMGLEPDDLAVYFVGRLSEEKNIDVYIAAAAAALKHPGTKHLKFFVVGDGVLRKDIERRIAEARTPNIKYLGYSSQIARFLSTADIFVLPSKIEGFPLSILEAMAMRVVVIASRVGAIPEILDDGQNGILVTPGSKTELMDAILKVSGDRQLLESFKAGARQKAEDNFSTIALGQSYRRFYTELLDK